MSISLRGPETLTEVWMTPRLYWIGLYEERDSKKGEWFFQVDWAPAIGYCAKRVVGEGKLVHPHVAAIGAGVDAKERTNSPVVAVLPRWHCHYLLAE
jgi:hypothetical protein